MKFTHLHCHGSYSVLDGLGSPEKMAKRAKELGYDAIGITDHGNIDCFVKWQNACEANGITPIFGCECYIDGNRFERGKNAKKYHLCVFIKNKTGFQNLQKLLSIANLEGFNRRPRIDPGSLLEHGEGLIVTSACVGGFLNADWGKKLLKDFSEKFPGDAYCEIMPIALDKQIPYNLDVIKTANELGLKIIATNDIHYVNPEDAELQEVLLCINSNDKWSNPNRFRFACNTHYMTTPKEMLRMFRKNHPDIPMDIVRESLDNTQEIVEKCKDFKLEKYPVVLPLIPQCNEGNEDEYLERLIYAGLKKKIHAGLIDKEKVSKYRERINEEFSLLKKKSFVRYFLVVWEMINWAKDNNIMVGPGRGSAGGSLIAYLIGIVDVDPLKYDLLFARFISPDRKDLPDVDMDFEDSKRHLVREHVQDLYGENNVAGISTFLSIKGKGSIRDVSRVFDVPLNEVNEVSKVLEDDEDLTVEYFRNNENSVIRNFEKKYPKVVDFACRLQHVIRGYGQHAAGVCISDTDLRDGTKCNLVKRKGELVCNWDKDDAEYMGLVKMDFLGLSALSRIHECLDLIEERTGERPKLSELELDDKKIFKMFAEGDTGGVFQFGTYGMNRLCQDLKIDSFKLLYNATALYRPGPLGSGMTEEFVKRKKGKSYKSICPQMEEITKDTYGIIVYQEQVMFACNLMGGMTWGECDRIRKLMAKSKGVEALEPFKEKFVSGCLKNTKLSETQAEEIWNQLAEFGKYGFNKCLDPETTVETYSGKTAKIKDVEIGEYINTPEGFCRIKGKHQNGIKRVYSVTLDNGRIIRCTTDHKFFCMDGKKHTVQAIMCYSYAILCDNGTFAKIANVEYAGEMETMDLEMENDSHTFYGNGIATSNSHSVEYSIISYWDAWLKHYYPLEFYASYLSFSSDEKKKELMEEIIAEGILVDLPKIGKSKATKWNVKDEKLVMPFSEIVGVGTAKAEEIENSSKRKRVGFFGSPSLGLPASTMKILNDIHAFDDKEIGYNELKKMRDYFIYDIISMFFEN